MLFKNGNKSCFIWLVIARPLKKPASAIILAGNLCFYVQKLGLIPLKHSRMVRHMGETIQRIFSKLFLTTFAKAQKKKN